MSSAADKCAAHKDSMSCNADSRCTWHSHEGRSARKALSKCEKRYHDVDKERDSKGDSTVVTRGYGPGRNPQNTH